MRPARSGTPWRLALCALLALALAAATLGLMTPGTLAQQDEVAPDEAATAQPEKAEEGEQKERKRSEEDIDVIHADQVTVEDYDDRDRAIYLLEGNVHLRQEDVNLFADVVTLDRGKETAEATGNLRVVDPENVIVGDFLAADFDEGRITLSGNVRLIHEETEEEEAAAGEDALETEDEGDAANASAATAPPAPQRDDEPQADGDEPKKKTVVTCDRLHYYYDDKRAICVGNVVAQQEGDTAYAHRAIYDEDAELLTLTGAVRIEREDGSVLNFEGAVINRKEHTIQAEGMADSTLVREKKEGGAKEAPEQPPTERLRQPGESTPG